MLKSGVLGFVLAILTLFLISNVSATALWEAYGHDNNISQAQIYEASLFQSGVSTSSVSFGYNVQYPLQFLVSATDGSIYRNMSYEPIITSFNNPNRNYIVFPESTNLDFYYQNSTNGLTLETQLSTGLQGNSQIAVTDWDNDGAKDDVAGVWNRNATLDSFRVYSFNYSTDTMAQIFEYNFTRNNSATTPFVSGVTCENTGRRECHFIFNYEGAFNLGLANSQLFNSTWVALNSTGTRTRILTPSTTATLSPFLEPIAIQDIDGDGLNEFMTFSSDLLIVKDNENASVPLGTNEIFYRPISDLDRVRILDAKLLRSSASNVSRIAVLSTTYTDSTSPRNWRVHLQLLSSNYPANATPTIVYDKTLASGSESGGSGNFMGYDGKLAIGSDYNGDVWDDIYVSVHEQHFHSSAVSTFTNYSIFRGYDGTRLWNNLSEPYVSGAVDYYLQSFTLADMNNNGYDDFIIHLSNGKTKIIDSYQNLTIFSSALTGKKSCIPADLIASGSLSLFCVATGSTGTSTLITATTSNSAPSITSVSFEPATIVAVNQTLTTTITATDSDSDTLYYSHQCFGADSWSANTTDNVKTCIYATTGNYTYTAGVTDLFHGYTQFSQTIQVTPEGFVCNNNAVCEAELGETSVNCATDCSSGGSSSGNLNTIEINSELVSTTNPNQGLLPEIYYGIIAFFSNNLLGIIIIATAFFFALIILGLGGLFKTLANKIGR